jgi:hypothetical protein
VERRITAEEVGEELTDRLRAERQERKLLVVGELHPRGVVLGTEVEQQERPVGGCDLDDDVLDELLARTIEPVKVLEEDYSRFTGAARARKPPEEVEKLALARFGTESWGRPLGNGRLPSPAVRRSRCRTSALRDSPFRRMSNSVCWPKEQRIHRRSSHEQDFRTRSLRTASTGTPEARAKGP